MAEQMEPGDTIVFYLTKVMAFAASVTITAAMMFEDRTKIWPASPGKADPYPWRFETTPEIVLDEDAWVPGRDARRRPSSTSASGRASTGSSPSRASCAPSQSTTRACCA